MGPLIALVSFVCSIGNVPLAAALWKGGISFGGVVSFIFADLISLPLLLIYRRYYGRAYMARMLVILWGVMSIPAHHRGHLPSCRPGTRGPAEPPRSGTLLLGLHDLPEHCLSSALRRPLLGVPEQGAPSGRRTLRPRLGVRMQARWPTHPLGQCKRQTVLLLLRSLSGALRGGSGTIRGRERQAPAKRRAHVGPRVFRPLGQERRGKRVPNHDHSARSRRPRARARRS